MLGRLFRSSKTGERALAEFPEPAPLRTIYAIGDLHGRSDLLDRLIDVIDSDADATGVSDPMIVFLGDYVDRGHDSKGVLERVLSLHETSGRTVQSLLGNHEDMLLDFIDQTGKRGHVWLDNGGLQTLESFGIGGLYATRSEAEISEAATRLAEAMGSRLIDWLRARPRQTRSGNVHFVHAAADPKRPMEQQDPEMLIWGRPSSRWPLREDGQWVIHGHTVVETPVVTPGLINVDTGAVYSGRLTAVRLDESGYRFLST